MKIRKIGGYNIGIVSNEQLMSQYIEPEAFDGEAEAYIRAIRKADEPSLKKILDQRSAPAPANMRKLMNLLDIDGYHSGCCDAIADGTIMDVANKDKQVQHWIDTSQNQGNIIRVIRTMVHHYQACGNGFAIKLRNPLGEWVGLETLMPHEMEIKYNYDENGFLKPNYVQYKNMKKQPFLHRDVIHLMKPHYKSNVWGLSSIPVAQGIETLKEIKQLDYNNFKSGLLIDYFIIVQGGSLSEEFEAGEGEDGSAYTKLEEQLRNATGTAKGHSSILIESDDAGVKIELIPLRQTLRDGEFQVLKQDIRDEMFAYHRVPKRIVAQATAGQLGGDNNSDMILFYNLVCKPIERELGEILSQQFIDEFGWDTKEADWDFGDLTNLFESDDMRMLRESM